MTGKAILSAIAAVLSGPLANAHMATFGPQARLDADLCLDSVLMMRLLLHLELDHGLPAPDSAVATRRLVTVADLAALYDGDPASIPAEPEPPAGSVHGDDYQDIKVHCVVSSLCHGLKRRGIDHRPFYFGVWDADLAVVDGALRYHAPSIDHRPFFDGFERLYGVPVESWYDPTAGKTANAETLRRLVATRAPEEHILVMVDLFLLPERENKFNQNPFPHYLMLEAGRRDEDFFVDDPDFRWEGEIAREKVIAAFMSPHVAGGHRFDLSRARPADPRDVADHFLACFVPDRAPLIEMLREILDRHVGARADRPWRELATAVRELPVTLIRKYAYEHGFAYFWRALKWDDAGFGAACDDIEALIQTLRRLHFALVRLSETEDATQIAAVTALLDEAERRERDIKHRLAAAFAAWRRLGRSTGPIAADRARLEDVR